METSSHNNYFWFQTFDTAFTIDKFRKEFTQHLVGKHVCVSSYDSGALHISNEEKQLGWQDLNNIATSPKIKINTTIPTAGFDEWYVFTKRPARIKLSSIYVNYDNFSLNDNSELVKNFWQDIEFNQPIIYISEGNGLKVVTDNIKLKQDIEKCWS